MTLFSTSARSGSTINASTIAIAYAAFGALWVFFSDRVLPVFLAHRPELLSSAQTIKGWIFIALTAVLLYLFARNSRQRSGETAASRDQRFSALVASLPDYAVAILLPDGRVANWSAAAEQITGFRAAEAVGLPLARLVASAQPGRNEPASMLAEAESHGSVATAGWHLRKDGTRYRARSVTTVLRERDGTTAGFIHVMRDMTAFERTAAPRDAGQAERTRQTDTGHDGPVGAQHGK